jgi:lantibiotic biosynthesis protein
MKNKSIKRYLYPQFICRVAGLPTDYCENLKFDSFLDQSQNYFTDVSEYTNIKLALVNELFLRVQNSSEKSERSKIIDSRREVIGDKKINKKNIELLSRLNLSEIILKYEKSLDQLEKKKKELIQQYNLEKDEKRRLFKKYLADEDFQKGLLISSKTLFEQQKYYVNSKTADHKTGQIERGLLRYFSRASMKATPFGTFCSIVPGYLKSGIENKAFQFTHNPQNKRSLLLINKDIYGIISKHLTKDSDLRKELNLELNKTIEKQETIYYYLTELDGKEIFQKLNINPILEIIEREVEKLGIIKYSKLATLIAGMEEFEATEEEIQNYLDKLIELGFLRFKIGIPEQMVDWITPLCDLLSKYKIPKAETILNSIEKLSSLVEEYYNLNSTERKSKLDEMNQLVENAFKELDTENKIRNNIPLYEDAKAETDVVISTEQLEKAANSIIKYIEATKCLAYSREEMANMRAFFDKQYPEKEKKISLLQFYEDYYKLHYKEHSEKQKKVQYNKNDEDLKKYNFINPFDLELIKINQQVRTKLIELVANKWITNPTAEELSLSYAELESITSLSPAQSLPNYSFTLFSQVVLPLHEKEGIKLIIPEGRYLLGFGKYFSRFIYLFKPKALKEMYVTNNNVEGEILAEISGDANFNANLHPPLVKHEISYPTSEIGMAEIPVKCTDLEVEINPVDINRLRLKHNISGNYIVPLDLGFLNPLMRPPLFQLLSKFMPPSNFGLPLPEYPVNKPKEENKKSDSNENDDNSGKEKNGNNEWEKKIIYRPRIIFENNIILSRRKWMVPKDLFPQLDSQESDFDFYLRVQKWMIENGIPEEVYIKIRPLPVKNNQPQAQNENNTPKEEAKEKNQIVENEVNNKANERKPGVPANNANQPEMKDKAPTVAAQNVPLQKAAQKKQSRDYYKPQYIDFNNPLLVDLFGKLTVDLKNYSVVLEERYPLKSQLLSFNGNTFSTEQIFQTNFFQNTNEKK